jgi:dolichol kinase
MRARSNEALIALHWGHIPIGICGLVLAIYWFAKGQIALGVLVAVLGFAAAGIAISRLRQD